jgi:hypothetical protein
MCDTLKKMLLIIWLSISLLIIYLYNRKEPEMINLIENMIKVPDIEVINVARNYFSYYNMYIIGINQIIDNDKLMHYDILFITTLLPKFHEIEEIFLKILTDKEYIIDKYVKNGACKYVREKIIINDIVNFCTKNINEEKNLEEMKKILQEHLKFISG